MESLTARTRLGSAPLSFLRLALPALALITAACGSESGAPGHANRAADAGRPASADLLSNRADGTPLAFLGATLWDGVSETLLEDAVLLVREGRIEALGSADRVRIPEGAQRIDLTGHWVIPGLINGHGHVGQARGLSQGPAAHTRENIEAQLAPSARYGVTTVVSLGEPGVLGVAVRDAEHEADGAASGAASAAGSAAGSEVGTAVPLDRARLRVAGPVLNPATPAEAPEQVAALARARVDWAKIRVDSFLGQAEKMSPETYRAVQNAATNAGLPLTAHVVELEDAKGLVRAGVPVLGHSVRDAPVDEELVDLMREAGTCLHPTLTREVSTFIYRSRPDFFDDPFFLRDADPGVLEALLDPEVQARYTGQAADWYRDQLPVATDNMVRLHEAGVRIAFGTDSGPPARFQGFFEHMELGMMQDAGLSPLDVLRSATSVAAACMRLEGVGRLEPGAWADLLVVRADPTRDVRNLRQIEAVFVAGNPVPGARFEGR